MQNPVLVHFDKSAQDIPFQFSLLKLGESGWVIESNCAVLNALQIVDSFSPL